MVMNLLYRHPNCKVLLHRKDPNISQIMTDPYDMAQTDPSECNALESCLWELQVSAHLRTHMSPYHVYYHDYRLYSATTIPLYPLLSLILLILIASGLVRNH